MESIVTLHQGSPVVSSLIIAESIGRAHKVVIELVRKNLSDFEEFGTLAFEMRVSGGHNGGGQRREVALLNEPQATLLMTFLRNSPVVKAFKKRLVHAFYEMAERLAEQENQKVIKLPVASDPPPLSETTKKVLESHGFRCAVTAARDMLNALPYGTVLDASEALDIGLAIVTDALRPRPHVRCSDVNVLRQISRASKI